LFRSLLALAESALVGVAGISLIMQSTALMWSVVQINLESDDEAYRLAIAADRLGLSPTRYWQVVVALLDVPAAWAAAPSQLEAHQDRFQALRRWRLGPGA
jgi:hypothetical protein